MATYAFQTISPAEALAFNATTDNLTATGDLSKFTVSFNDAAQRVTITDVASGHAVTFGSGIYGALIQGVGVDQMRIGSSGSDSIPWTGTVHAGAGDDVIYGGTYVSGGPGADVFIINRRYALEKILDWESGDRLYMSFLKATISNYVETTKPDEIAARDFAGDQIQAGIDYIVVAVGGDLLVFADTGSGISAFWERATIVGRGLNDISYTNFLDDPSGGGSGSSGGSGGGGGGGGSVGSGSTTFDTFSPSAALAIQPSDTVTFQTGTATDVSVSYGAGSITLTMGGKSVVFGPDIAAVSQAGRIVLPDGSKLYIGQSGADAFTGAVTGDAAFGGPGDDILDGSAGGDLLHGNQGVDRLLGGDGADTVYGGQDDDTLLLGAGGDFGQGNRGQDYLQGGDGADVLLGGQDDDTVLGDLGADFLTGNRGNDSLSGGPGDDVIYGESGADTISGGAGADIFHGFDGGELDKVIDFNRAEGDRVVLDPGTAYTFSQAGADVVVAYGSNQIVLVGVSMASLTGEWISA